MSHKERITPKQVNENIDSASTEYSWDTLEKARKLPKNWIKWDYTGRDNGGRPVPKEGSMTISSDMLTTAINYLAEIGWDGSIESQYILVYTAQQQSILRGENERVFDISKWHTFKEYID